jgi:hypothetical protein
MARLPVVEPRSAIDYDDRGVRAMHAVLIELGQILGPYRDAIVVVGGAVPYLMLREARRSARRWRTHIRVARSLDAAQCQDAPQ